MLKHFIKEISKNNLLTYIFQTEEGGTVIYIFNSCIIFESKDLEYFKIVKNNDNLKELINSFKKLIMCFFILILLYDILGIFSNIIY